MAKFELGTGVIEPDDVHDERAEDVSVDFLSFESFLDNLPKKK